MSTKKQGANQKTPPAPALSAFAKAAAAAGLTSAVGKAAVEGRYRDAIESKTARTRFTGSVDMDGAFKQSEPTSNRWDFGVGLHAPGNTECAIWVEPHSAASTGEVKKILAKLDWLQDKLKQPEFRHLKALTDACVAQKRRPYHWMATAHVSIRPGSREANLLAARGMNLPSTRVVI